MRLYEENEPGRFPPNTSGLYANHLRASGCLTLVMEQEGRIVGTGGVSLKSDPAGRLYCWLSFGLIAPTYHRLGLGTALLLARIALLPADRLPLPAFLTAVWRSRSFYERFGFQLFCLQSVEEPPVVGYFVATVPPGTADASRRCLREAGVQMPEIGLDIPVLHNLPTEQRLPTSLEHAGARWLGSTTRELLVSRPLSADPVESKW